MYCEQCGHQIGDTAHFCGACGQARSGPVARPRASSAAPATLQWKNGLLEADGSELAILDRVKGGGRETIAYANLRHVYVDLRINAGTTDVTIDGLAGIRTFPQCSDIELAAFLDRFRAAAIPVEERRWVGALPVQGGSSVGSRRSPGASGRPSTGVARAGYGLGRRTIYGGLWAFYAAVLVIAGFAALVGGNAVGLLTLAVGCAAAVYSYRIWTWQARHLWLLIFF